MILVGCALSREMFEDIIRLNLRSVLGNNGNVTECRRLIDDIESLRFRELPSTWSARGMLPSLSPERMDQGTDYCLYNPFIARSISVNEELVVLCGMDCRLPAGYTTGWDFSKIDD